MSSVAADDEDFLYSGCKETNRYEKNKKIREGRSEAPTYCKLGAFPLLPATRNSRVYSMIGWLAKGRRTFGFSRVTGKKRRLNESAITTAYSVKELYFSIAHRAAVCQEHLTFSRGGAAKVQMYNPASNKVQQQIPGGRLLFGSPILHLLFPFPFSSFFHPFLCLLCQTSRNVSDAARAWASVRRGTTSTSMSSGSSKEQRRAPLLPICVLHCIVSRWLCTQFPVLELLLRSPFLFFSGAEEKRERRLRLFGKSFHCLITDTCKLRIIQSRGGQTGRTSYRGVEGYAF